MHARARKGECDSKGEISLPHPRTLVISSLTFFKNGWISDMFGVFMWKAHIFIFKWKAEAWDREWPQWNTIITCTWLLLIVFYCFLAHLSWKLLWAILISCCQSIHLSVNFLHFYLFQNHWASFTRNWHKESLGKRN